MNKKLVMVAVVVCLVLTLLAGGYCYRCQTQ